MLTKENVESAINRNVLCYDKLGNGLISLRLLHIMDVVFKDISTIFVSEEGWLQKSENILLLESMCPEKYKIVKSNLNLEKLYEEANGSWPVGTQFILVSKNKDGTFGLGAF
jgi:hypothetical protein